MLRTSPLLPLCYKNICPCLPLSHTYNIFTRGAGQGLAPKLDRRGECNFRDLIVLECSLSEFCSTPQITLLSHPKFYYGHILMSSLPPPPAVLWSQSNQIYFIMLTLHVCTDIDSQSFCNIGRNNRRGISSHESGQYFDKRGHNNSEWNIYLVAGYLAARPG